MLVGRPQSDPMDVCPQPTSGATVRLVCTLSSPLPGAGLAVEWCGPCLGYFHTSRLVVLLQWDLAYLPGWIHKVQKGQRGRLSSLCHWQSPAGGPCITGREVGPSEGWIHRSTVLGVCAMQALSVTGTGSLWDFGLGMGHGNGACQ